MSEWQDEWEVVALGDVAEIINGRAYKLSEWETSGTPVIRLQNLTQRGGDFYFSNLALPEKQYCAKGDLLYMWSATFGPHIWWGEKAIFHYHIWKIEPSERIDKKFLFYLLDAKTQEWKTAGSGMAMIHLTKAGIEKELLCVPPLPEQKKIAEILSGIDGEIGTLSKQIQKYQQIRAATIKNQILNGKGVTARLGDIFQIQWGNTSITKASYTDNGFTAFSASGADGYLSSYEHDCKGIVISAIGAQCGKVFWAEGKWTAIKNTMTITAGSSAVTLRYLYHILSPGDYLTGEGGAQPFISQAAAREKEIFLPDPREMSAFEEGIDKMDEIIRLSSEKLSKAKLLKSSVSSDLLSGRRRVSA